MHTKQECMRAGVCICVDFCMLEACDSIALSLSAHALHTLTNVLL